MQRALPLPASRPTPILGFLRAIPRTELFVFALLMISAKTTLASIAPIDTVARGLMGFSLLLSLLDRQNIGRAFTFASASLLLYGLGCLYSYFYSPDIWPPENLFNMAVVIFAGSFVICSDDRPFSRTLSAWTLIGLALLYLALTFATGGLVLEVIPTYIYEVFDEFGQQQYVVYSQGVSKLFALVAIPCFFFAARSTHEALKWTLYGVGLIFVTQSFIGGARGEFLALAVCLVLVLMRRNKMAFFIIMMLIFALLSIMPQVPGDDVVIINRFLHLWQDETLGGRSELFADAIQILRERPQCAILGCGLQYFQDFWGIPGTAYPHNYVLDLFIVYGIPFTVFIYFVYFRSTWHFMRNPQFELNAYILLYLFIVSMKSGSPIVDHLFWIFLARQLMTLRHSPTAAP